MREILFRGKRLDNGAWETGSLVIVREDLSDERDFIADNMTGYHTPIKKSTIGQYTGLTDNNGKMIFEGDIVEGDDFNDEDGYGVIEWDDDGARFTINGAGIIADFDNYYWHELEIIGNIHDNQDLVGE